LGVPNGFSTKPFLKVSFATSDVGRLLPTAGLASRPFVLSPWSPNEGEMASDLKVLWLWHSQKRGYFGDVNVKAKGNILNSYVADTLA